MADHAKWAKHFGAKRIIHQNETTDHQGTKECEIQITGEGPTWAFPDGDDDLTLIATPGHTEHHVVLHSKRHKVRGSTRLFCGAVRSGAGPLPRLASSSWTVVCSFTQRYRKPPLPQRPGHCARNTACRRPPPLCNPGAPNTLDGHSPCRQRNKLIRLCPAETHVRT